MKHYSVKNYIRYKEQLTERLFEECCNSETSREHLIECARPLVEAVAWKFVLTYQASGVMSILDLIQEGLHFPIQWDHRGSGQAQGFWKMGMEFSLIGNSSKVVK